MPYKTKEKLAKFAIKYFLTHQREPVISSNEIPPTWQEYAACFVTIFVDKKLHGCIGSIVARQPLYQEIVANAIKAATEDWRFSPIQQEELPQLTTEVSVLTSLEEYIPENNQALLIFLSNERPGLMLELNGQQALFLPQVWEDLPNPQEFLAHLCLKASLPPESWQNKKMRFWAFGKREDI